MMVEHKLVKLDTPKNYPKEMFPLDGKLTPMKLSFTSLKTALLLASRKYLDVKWKVMFKHTYLLSV